MLEAESKSSIQAHVLSGVAELNKAIGKGISYIPKLGDDDVVEALFDAGKTVDNINNKRTANTMELFAKEECTCVQPFVDNICAINIIYNEPLDLLFDNEHIYFNLAEAK